MKLSQEFNKIFINTKSIGRQFEYAMGFAKNDSNETIIQYLENALKNLIPKIIKNYNAIISENQDLRLKFRNYLNTLEKLRNQFYIDIENNDLMERLEYYVTKFKELAQNFQETFAEELQR